MLHLQSITANVNMKYAKIMLTLEAVIDAFKELWKYPETFSNVFIHLGDFHFMNENFNIIFKLG